MGDPRTDAMLSLAGGGNSPQSSNDPRTTAMLSASQPAATAAAPTNTPDTDAESEAESRGETLGIPGLISDPQTGKGILRGMVRTYLGATEGSKAADAEAPGVFNMFGIGGDNGPHSIAGETLGGFLAPLPGGPKGELSEAPAAGAIKEGHPLTGPAKAEQARIDNAMSHPAAQGIPSKGVTPLQDYARTKAREDIGLPDNSPVTPTMAEKAINQTAGPIFRAVDSTPAYVTGPKYGAAARGVDPSKIDPITVTETGADGTRTSRQISLPKEGDSISGADTRTLSRNYRSRADKLYDYAESPGIHPDEAQAAISQAENYKAAAKAVETGYAEAEPVTGAKWDQARQYTAKVKSWEPALDSAGNVDPTKIKRAVAGESITSQAQQDLATVAARSANKAAPPGMARQLVNKAVRYGLPAAGVYVAGHHGGAVGQELADHVTGGGSN